MVCPDLISTNIGSKPPATALWSIAVVPIVDEDLKSLCFLILACELALCLHVATEGAANELGQAIVLARQRYGHARQAHAMYYGSRPSSPSYPGLPPDVAPEALTSRPWSGKGGVHSLLADQRLIQLGQSQGSGLNLNQPDYSIIRSEAGDASNQGRLPRAAEPAGRGGSPSYAPLTAAQAQFLPPITASANNPPPPRSPQQQGAMSPGGAPAPSAPTYDVHLYDANLVSGMMAAAAAASVAAKYKAMAPMNNALAQFYTQSTGPARTGHLPAAYPLPPSRRIPTTGFPLIHPFGEAPAPRTQNFGSMPEFPGRVSNAGAMEFEGRAQGVF